MSSNYLDYLKKKGLEMVGFSSPSLHSLFKKLAKKVLFTDIRNNTLPK
ncbi:hypothetical protein RV12_GL002101 [Enterococcus quebecensis]|nr:hypothetical protein RV12_GL002101 [Enterococcus quebecensis]